MSLITELYDAVVALTNTVNQIAAGSKTNEELPLMNPFNREALVRSSVLGVSEASSWQDFVDEIADEFIRGNVPGKFRNVIIDQTTESPSDIIKMKTAINAAPNYVLEEGAMYFFTNKRLVLTNGSYGFPRPGGYYAVLTDYYILSDKIQPDVNGIASVGVDGTELFTSSLHYVFSIDNRSYEPIEFDLGDIGANFISARVNVTGPYSTPNGAVVVFTAIQNGEEESWLYLNNEEEIGNGRYQTVEGDFKIFDDDDLPPNHQETLPSGYNVSRINAPLDNHEGYLSDMVVPSVLNSFVTDKHRLGGKARFLISTVGKIAFPVISSVNTDAIITLIDSCAFEANQTYELIIECVFVSRAIVPVDQITYKFIKRDLVYGTGGSGGSTSEIPLDDQHVDITALIANQASQIDGEFHMVDDATDDPDINSGWAIYDYLGTTLGTIDDYLLIQSEESLNGKRFEDRLIEDASVTGTYLINYAIAETWWLTMIADTVFSESNLPGSGSSKPITIYLSGDFVPSWPAGHTTYTVGTYDNTKINVYVIEYIKPSTYNIQITQLN